MEIHTFIIYYIKKMDFVRLTVIFSIKPNKDVSYIGSTDFIDFIFIILVILFLVILAMAPFDDVLNQRETTPDWVIRERQEQEDRRREDDINRKLCRQADIGRNDTVWKQKDIYNQSFPLDARLDVLDIIRLHNRPVSLLLFQFKIKDNMAKLHPIRNTGFGPYQIPVRAADYLKASDIRWW